MGGGELLNMTFSPHNVLEDKKPPQNLKPGKYFIVSCWLALTKELKDISRTLNANGLF